MGDAPKTKHSPAGDGKLSLSTWVVPEATGRAALVGPSSGSSGPFGTGSWALAPGLPQGPRGDSLQVLT